MANNFLKEEQKKYENISEYYRKDANEYDREISKHLILVASIIIGFSSSLIKNKLMTSNYCLKIIFLVILTLFVISIGFGILQFIQNYKFFTRWSSAALKVVEAISKKEVDSEEKLKEKVKSAQEGLIPDSPVWAVYVQSTLLFVGFVLFILLFIEMFFKY